MSAPRPGEHRLSDIDAAVRKATCAVCGPVSIVQLQGAVLKRSGERKRWWRCEPRYREGLRERERRRGPRTRYRNPWRAALRERLDRGVCERCGFVAEHMGQLDGDHIVRQTDGGSDDPSNLCVLCANCHRLKSILERLPGWDYVVFMSGSG